MVVALFIWATFLHASFSWYFDRGYAATLSILPEISNNPKPDVQHLLLQLFSAGVVLFLGKAVFQRTFENV